MLLCCLCPSKQPPTEAWRRKAKNNGQLFNLSSHFCFIQYVLYWLMLTKNLFYILPMMPFLVLLQNQIYSTRPVLAQENENFADIPCGPGKADGEEETHKDWIISEIKSAYSASTLWTQMHTGGKNPCRLMKLIMRNHSSSMRSNDERADPHMWILIVQYKRWTTRHENLISVEQQQDTAFKCLWNRQFDKSVALFLMLRYFMKNAFTPENYCILE